MKDVIFWALLAATCCGGAAIVACGSSDINEQTGAVGAAGDAGMAGGSQSGSGGMSSGGVGTSTGGTSTGGHSATGGSSGGNAGAGGSIGGNAGAGGSIGGAGGSVGGTAGTGGSSGSGGSDGGVGSVCTLPPDSGPCEAAMRRFYYNPSIGDCVEFVYGGCQGNANNFETIDACRQACASTNICTLPMQPGSCRGAFARWYFNSSTGQCEQFTYGGCDGNANNFETEAACMTACVSSSGCGCIAETISWGDVGGLVAYVDRSEVAPCATYSHRRDPTITDPPSIECSQELMTCPGGRLGLSDLVAALSSPDVAAARASAPVLYGSDTRPVDGTVLQIVIGSDVIEVGMDCGSTPSCTPIPAGVAALAELLRMLDTQELGLGDCALAFPSR